MASKRRKPEPIGNVWTPGAIKAEALKLKRRGHKNLWVHSGFEPRQPLF